MSKSVKKKLLIPNAIHIILFNLARLNKMMCIIKPVYNQNSLGPCAFLLPVHLMDRSKKKGPRTPSLQGLSPLDLQKIVFTTAMQLSLSYSCCYKQKKCCVLIFLLHKSSGLT